MKLDEVMSTARDDQKGQENTGGGFGLNGRPAGVYLIKDGHVHWRPAVDPNRLIRTVALVVVAYLFTRPRVLRARSASPGRRGR